MTLLQALRSVILVLFAALVALPFGAVAAQETDTQLTVELQEFKNSGISGTAVLTATFGGLAATLGGDTQVSMELRGEELDGNHPSHIHSGSCANFDPNPLYALETVELSPVNREGISESTVEDVTPASLREGDYVIVVHQSPEELTNYLVCGEISGGTVGEINEGEHVSGTEHEQATSQTGTGDDSAATADHSGSNHGEVAKATEVPGKVVTLPKAGSGATTTSEGPGGNLLFTGLGALSLLALLSSRVLRQRRA